MGSTALKDVTALVAEDLVRVAAIVEEALRPPNQELRPLLEHVGNFRGKQLRSALVLLAGKHLGCRRLDVHLEVAAIIEMIHAATLVHDDILDGAVVRRNLATLNAIHGPEVSVLLGDYIYARAFQMSVSLPDERCSKLLSDVTRVICQGEMTQMLHRWDLDLSEEKYLQIIGEKTAILYGAAGELGAVYAGGGDPATRAFCDFGYNLGLAFQIIDDCLDVEGDEQVVGKSLGTDFGKGKLTLPFLWVLHGLGEEGRQRFTEIFRARDSAAAKQALLAQEFDLTGGLAYAHARADGYLRAALACLDDLRETEYLESLRAMADFVLHRRS